MKQKFTLLFAFVSTVIMLNAQSYSHGDISLNFLKSITHDSSQCHSTGSLSYNITVQNSFTGDSLKVVDPNTGQVLYAAGNATGQNPWQFVAPVFPGITLSDNTYYNGFVSYQGGESKVISGTDTINPVYNQFNYPVSNPCDYDTLSGKMYFDNNSNCIFDAGDVPAYGLYVQFKYSCTNPPTGLGASGLAMVFGNGRLRMHVQESWLSWVKVNMHPALQFIYPLSSCATPSYYFTTLPQVGVDFPIHCSSLIDVQASAATSGAVRPLKPFMLHPAVSNTGCDSANGTLTVVLDPRVTYSAIQSTNPPTTVNGNTLQWNYANISNTSSGAYWNNFLSELHLTPNGSVNIGDTLCFNVSATFQAGDVNAANNTYTLCVPVVNSFDPNIKEVEPAGTGAQGYIPVSTEELAYTVHFQNTGNAWAFDVLVVDTLDGDIDENSLSIIGASHSMSPEWLGPGVVRFNFNDIYLADSFSNEPESHGFVKFKVKLKSALPIGTQIKNTAAIYFDTNPPIFTNTTLNTIAANSAISEFGPDSDFRIWPNPANNATTIIVDESAVGSTATISDIAGRILKTYKLETTTTQLETACYTAGIYFVNLTGKSGRNAAKKLVIEN